MLNLRPRAWLCLLPTLACFCAAAPPAGPVESITLSSPVPAQVTISRTPTRDILCLNGIWEQQIIPSPAYTYRMLPEGADFPAPVLDDRPAAKPEYHGPQRLPTLPQQAGDMNQVKSWKYWYTRKVMVPESWRGNDVILQFMAAGLEVVAYVNGRCIGSHIGDSTGFEFDATPAIRYGAENEIWIRVWTHWSAYGDNWPQGIIESIWNRRSDIWDDMYLKSVPPARVDSVFIKPSWRHKRLTVDAVVKNARGVAGTYVAGFTVTETDGAPVLSCPPVTVTLPAGGSQTVELAAPWKKPRLWLPEDPHLYLLKTKLLLDGKVIDERVERFGFSETWIAGTDFYHNGIKRRFHCITAHSMEVNWRDKNWAAAQMRFFKTLGYNMIRSFEKPNYLMLEAADEAGMFIKAQDGWHHGNTPLTPVFKKNTARFVQEWVARDRNHPSIICWDAANEPDGHYESVQYVMDEIRKNDPTRPVDVDRSYGVTIYDWSGMPKKTDNYNPQHQTNALDRFEIANPHYPITCGLPGYSMLTAAEYPARWMKYGTLPLFFGEWSDFVNPGRVPLGEDHYTDLRNLRYFVWFHAHETTPAGWLRYLGDIYPYWRRWGVSGYDEWLNQTVKEWFTAPMGDHGYPVARTADPYAAKPIPVTWTALDTPGLKFDRVDYASSAFVNPGWFKDLPEYAMTPTLQRFSNLFKPVYAFFPDRTRQVYGGEAFSRELTLINDTIAGQPFKGRVELVMAGRTVKAVEFARAVKQGAVGAVTIAMTLPTVTERTPAELRISLGSVPAQTHAEPLPLVLCPPVPPGADSAGVALYDPDGGTAAALRRLGVRATRLDTPVPPAGAKVLVIGHNAQDDKVMAAAPALCAFAAAGGKLVILHQDTWQNFLPVSLLTQNIDLPQVWPVANSHPALQGLDKQAFAYWPNNRGQEFKIPGAVCSRPFRAVRSGLLKPLLVAGYNSDEAALLSMPFGKGEILLCQLDLIPVAGICPPADRLLLNLARPAVAVPRARTLWFAGPAENRDVLERLGFLVRELEPAAVPRVDDLLVWWPGDTALPEAVRQQAGAAIRAGTAALVLAANDRQLPPLPRPPVFGDALKYRDEVYVMQAAKPEGYAAPEGRCIHMAFPNRQEPLVDGVTNAAMARSSYRNGSFKLADFEIEAANGYRQLTEPGVIAETRPAGNPVVLVTAIRTGPAGVVQQFDAMLKPLLINLGARGSELAAAVPAAHSEKFTPVDLRPYCTMGFSDTIAGDGKGGWSDQGPQNDLSCFPVNQKRFENIPFDIIDPAKNNGKSCVVLGSDQLKALSRKVTIDLGSRKARRLYFLHGAAWAPGQGTVGRYTVTYGQALRMEREILLTCGVNIADWYVPQELEKATVAWRGDNARSLVGLYLLVWENPHPDTIIDSITFEATDANAILGLVGLTAEE
ncbi:MAG: glycoside hydrolase family 2 TIM barrel-domain containing protein [Lentisphaeria bacterium]